MKNKVISTEYVEKNYISIKDLKKVLDIEEYDNIDVLSYISTLKSEVDRLEDIEDRLAKTIVKIYSKMLFNFTKGLNVRASIPFHIVLEESHRYVQNDNDVYLLGYNIFERIAKEGRKFGLILNLISQRPVELSETVISQCSNI